MIEQGTPEWFAQRCGKVTASRIADLMAKTRSGWGASRKNYQAQLVAERITETVAESFSNAAMQWGVEKEPEAREAYEAHNLADVELAPFVPHPTIPNAGASPDGFVGSDGLVEIKCPNTATHIETLLSGKIADKYMKQMQWQMACTGAQWCDFVSYDPRMGSDLLFTQWCDFVSYDPRMGADLSLWIKRVDRDQALIDEIEKAVLDFNNEIEQQVSALENLKETQ